MDDNLGQALTRWTICVAVALYLVRVGADVAGGDKRGSEQIARFSWTAGLVFFLIHIVCAFHFYHSWSHDAAYTHTAKATARVVGIDWGGGIYFNYAFTLFWLGDVLVWWYAGGVHIRKSRRRFLLIHAVFAFMVLNATVVFGPAYWKWVAVGATAALIGLSRLRNEHTDSELDGN